MIAIDLVRHGLTEFNVERRMQGMANSNLTDLGRTNAEALGRGLAASGKTYDAVYASDLTRAHDTAALVVRGLGSQLEVATDLGLREENYGRYEGMLVDDFAREVLGVSDFNKSIATGRYTLDQIADKTWAANSDAADNPAETALMVKERLDQAIRGIAVQAERRGQTHVLAVSHGTALLMWLDYCGRGVDGLEMLHNVSVSTVYYEDGEFTVKDIDNMTYLNKGLAGK